jgi:predicted membrane protein
MLLGYRIFALDNHLIEENMETNFNHHHRRSGHGVIFFAFLLILAGTTYTLFDMGIIPLVYKPVIFSWQMLMTVIGLYQLLTRNIVFGIILTGVGVGFLLPLFNRVFPEFHLTLYWPYILIGIGVVIIVRQLFFRSKYPCGTYYKYAPDGVDVNVDVNLKRDNKRMSTEQTNGDKMEKNVAFSSSEQIVFSQDFQGGEVNVAFGELKLDLRKAKLADVNYLEANVCFGSIVLYVPVGWKIHIKSDTFFGNVEDNRHFPQQADDDSQPTLNLKGTAVFSNIEIRN